MNGLDKIKEIRKYRNKSKLQNKIIEALDNEMTSISIYIKDDADYLTVNEHLKQYFYSSKILFLNSTKYIIELLNEMNIPFDNYENKVITIIL